MMEERSDDVPLQPPAPVIGIIYNLKKGLDCEVPDAEAECDNIETVYAIRDALESGGYQTVLLEADATLPQRLRETPIDMAFNIAEGLCGRGREAQIPALLNMLGIPFTGSDETTLCVSLDKALTKRLLTTYHVRTPKYVVFDGETSPHLHGMRFPVILKPNAEGSSKGISDVSIAENMQELKALVKRNTQLYHQPMLAEEYIEGREFTVGILGNGKDAVAFPPMEILFRRSTQASYHVYDYHVKQDYQNYIDYKCPADIPNDVQTKMTKTALKIFHALGCRDFARVDFRVSEDNKVYFIEINPLPGLAPGYSDFPMLAEFSGVPYRQLVLSVLETGAARCGLFQGGKR
ncbi:MAG: ATP-grasp domain-containing protein [Angelakisella sp.]|nr:ATP-grasp domain-containing protein [Angelakisella sp.]